MVTNINVKVTCLGFVLNCSFKSAGIDMTVFVIKPLYNFEGCQSDCHCYSLRIGKKNTLKDVITKKKKKHHCFLDLSPLELATCLTG